jgi:hypothetical protein
MKEEEGSATRQALVQPVQEASLFYSGQHCPHLLKPSFHKQNNRNRQGR